MKNLKLGVLALGVVGLVGLLMTEFVALLQHDTANQILMIAGFGMPIAMAVMALKKPFERWQGAVSLVGFVLVVIKVRAWESIKQLGDHPMGLKLVVIAAVVGAVLSATTIAAPEEA